MNYKDISELIKTVSDSKLTSFEIKIDGVYLKMAKGEKITQITSLPTDDICTNLNTPVKKEVAVEVVEKYKVEDVEDCNITLVKSPIVGTFYSSPSPEKGPFVQVGAKVKKGDTLCIIEAMKLMNDIEADMDGEIVDILVNDEEMVEFGQPLFKIKK